MIYSKEDLNEYILNDNRYVCIQSRKQRIISSFCREPSYVLNQYLYYLRKEEYYINTAKGNRIKGMIGVFYDRRRNKLGNLLGIEIGPNCFGKGLTVYHIGSIIVNPYARIGENCKLHGANCIGNNGKTDGVPHIGNNVDIGYGAVIIGDIVIADNVTIGANSVVNKSVLEQGCIVAGVPATIIRHKGN